MAVKQLLAILRPRSNGFSPGPPADQAGESIDDNSTRYDPGNDPVRRFAFAVLLGLAACATASAPGRAASVLTPHEMAMAFQLEAPAPQALGPDLRLWATHYHTPIIRPAPKTVSAAFPLLDREGNGISPPLRHKDWCDAALQGSVSIQQGKTATAYVYVDSNGPEQANCDEYLGKLSDGVKNATRRARFMKVNHALGCGVRNIPLTPFRTVAVDTDIIPIGSVLYVPELRGRTFEYEGRGFVHDGYLFAGDRGGAIRGRHIDVFMTDTPATPFEDIFASTRRRTFSAHIVNADHPAASAVRDAQSGQCGEAS
jgi:3D (Asp-Asp-Asp) domain-containing protein